MLWIQISVAEPPFFWAAPAPAAEAQSPGADSGSDQIGSALTSAPVPEKKGGSRRLRLQTLKSVILSSKKVNLFYSVLGHVYLYELN